MSVKPWIDYDLCEQVIWCQVCGRMKAVRRWEPVSRFLGLVSAFSLHHEHRELSHEERREAIRHWRDEPEAG